MRKALMVPVANAFILACGVLLVPARAFGGSLAGEKTCLMTLHVLDQFKGSVIFIQHKSLQVCHEDSANQTLQPLQQ